MWASSALEALRGASGRVGDCPLGPSPVSVGGRRRYAHFLLPFLVIIVNLHRNLSVVKVQCNSLSHQQMSRLNTEDLCLFASPNFNQRSNSRALDSEVELDFFMEESKFVQKTKLDFNVVCTRVVPEVVLIFGAKLYLSTYRTRFPVLFLVELITSLKTKLMYPFRKVQLT